MVEFQVMKCAECQTFQVLQVTKTKKWACKLCGLKQSTSKVYGQGTGADCRKHVQKLNSLRGEIEWTSQEQSLKPLSSVSAYTESASSHLGHVNQNQEKSSPSRWSQYVDDKDEEIQEDTMVLETDMMVFSDWAQTCHKNKSYRSSIQTNEASSCKRLNNSRGNVVTGGNVVNVCKSFQKPSCQQKKDWHDSSITLSTWRLPEQASFQSQFSEIVTNRTPCPSSTAVLQSEKTLNSKDRSSAHNSGANKLVSSSSSQWQGGAGSTPMFSIDQHGTEKTLNPRVHHQNHGKEKTLIPRVHHQNHGTDKTLIPRVHHQNHGTDKTLIPRVHHQKHGSEGTLNLGISSVTKSLGSKWHSFLQMEDPCDEDSDEDLDGQVQDLVFIKNLKVPVSSSSLPSCLLELSDSGVNTGCEVNSFHANDAKPEVSNFLVDASLGRVRHRPPDCGLRATFHLDFDIDEDLQV